MKFNGNVGNWVFGLILFGGTAFAGTFEGIVATDTNLPMENVIVILTDSQGNTQQTMTLPDGSYAFPNLNAGWYTVYIVNPPGYLLLNPPCGYHFKYVKSSGTTKGHFGLKAGSSGVVVEFGKPGGGSSPGIVPIHQNGSQFSVSVFLANLGILTTSYPQTIIIRGYWLVPGTGAIMVKGLSGQGAGRYVSSTIDVSFRPLSKNRVEITLTNLSWPFFAWDGEAVTLDFTILGELSSLQELSRQLVFCFESVTVLHGGSSTTGQYWPFACLLL